MIIDNKVVDLRKEEISALEKRGVEFDAMLGRHKGQEFAPYADYDQELDCIRVVVRDCSVCEFRITEWLTVLHDNDPESAPAPIGCTIKGIRVLLGSHEGIVKLTELLDAVVKKNPDETVLQVVSMLRKLTHQNRLEEVQLPQSA